MALFEDQSKTVAHILGAETAMLDEPVRELAHVLQSSTVLGEVSLQIGCRLLLLAEVRASASSSGKSLRLHRCLCLIICSMLIA